MQVEQFMFRTNNRIWPVKWASAFERMRKVHKFPLTRIYFGNPLSPVTGAAVRSERFCVFCAQIMCVSFVNVLTCV